MLPFVAFVGGPFVTGGATFVTAVVGFVADAGATGGVLVAPPVRVTPSPPGRPWPTTGAGGKSLYRSNGNNSGTITSGSGYGGQS